MAVKKEEKSPAGSEYSVSALVKEHSKRKTAIRRRLDDFRKVWGLPDRKIFAELCFCICTPQSKAVYCDEAVRGLERSGVLFTGEENDIRRGLVRVRFPNNKSRFIREARDTFTSRGRIEIKKHIDVADITGTRERLVNKVKGIGYKEASHFLRNIGHGSDIAILDVHIIKNMIRYGLIEDKPSCISRGCYMDMEEKLRAFSKKTAIPMDEMDILFWSMETGVIFK
ncbi:MAG TPA: N-glycosylase/DNA lyase [Candidatus Omnitrophota bacterium]|nr:N-glycosylase/DNA lyase [Candidatus Omnitrophota bacterium]